MTLSQFWNRLALSSQTASTSLWQRSFVSWRNRATQELTRNDEPKSTLIGGTGGGSGARGPQPYLQPKPNNIRYNPRIYEGGVLPRIPWNDEPVKLPDYEPTDKWAPHRAYFGQNDYIGR